MKGKAMLAALLALVLSGTSAAAQWNKNRHYIFYQPVRFSWMESCPRQAPEKTGSQKPSQPQSAPSGENQGGSFLSAMEKELIRQVNGDRARYGLPALTHNAQLSRAARVRAREIVQKFSHTRPDGSSWKSVSALARGENIAKGQQTADKVMAAWMSSQGHRANILRNSFGSIGVAAYRKNGILYWVQLFGR